MIFASDLDRTLIYSDKFINENYPKDKVLDIERKMTDKGCKIISYISKETQRNLKVINERSNFIPVTTRSKDQYKRIELFQEEIKPQYAITSNGGNIFIDGEIDKNWQEIVAMTLELLPLDIDTAFSKFPREAGKEWLVNVKKVEGVFFYCVVEETNFQVSYLEAFKTYLESNGWRVHFHGRKIYFMPEPISKEHALKYIVANYMEETNTIYTAGDSDMDITMAVDSDRFYVPRHGEIYNHLESYPENKHKYYVTEGQGFLASEEIVLNVVGQLNVGK